MIELGKNVKGQLIGDKLLLEIMLDQELGLTKKGEGKNTAIATTNGSLHLGGGKYLGLNVWKKGEPKGVFG